MRLIAVTVVLFLAACVQDAENNSITNPNNGANNNADVDSNGDPGSDMGSTSDLAGNNGGDDASNNGGDDAGNDGGEDAGNDGGEDAGNGDDAGGNADGGADTGSSTDMATDTCVDADGDDYFVDCDDYTNVQGPDCDDDDPDNWNSCAACSDADGDLYFDGCDAYTTRMGPDCDDGDENNWSACGTCTDVDGDGWYDDCDAYVSIDGPDCDDGDTNNWMSCASCADGDNDDYWADCDAYDTIDGPDCDDSAGAVNPGANEIPNNGIDDDCDPTTADAMCQYSPNPATNPESGFNAGITAEHNYWRWRVGTAPLTWNATLAASAEAYAQNCIWQHDSGRSPDAGFSYVGENLYFSSGTASNALVLNAVQSWASERADYDYGVAISNSNFSTFGHYTQVVWDNSTDLGCGYAYCPSIQGLGGSGTIVACRYGPGGNYIGQTPYDYVNDVCVDLDNDDVMQGDDADDTDRSVQ